MRTNLSCLTAAARVLVVTAAAAVAPCLARAAVAQRAPSIRATAFIAGPVQAIALRADTVTTPPVRPETERIRIAGLGIIDVASGPGGVTRVTPVDPDRPTRAVRITIDYVGN